MNYCSHCGKPLNDSRSFNNRSNYNRSRNYSSLNDAVSKIKEVEVTTSYGNGPELLLKFYDMNGGSGNPISAKLQKALDYLESQGLIVNIHETREGEEIEAEDYANWQKLDYDDISDLEDENYYEQSYVYKVLYGSDHDWDSLEGEYSPEELLKLFKTRVMGKFAPNKGRR